MTPNDVCSVHDICMSNVDKKIDDKFGQISKLIIEIKADIKEMKNKIDVYRERSIAQEVKMKERYNDIESIIKKLNDLETNIKNLREKDLVNIKLTIIKISTTISFLFFLITFLLRHIIK